MVDLNLSTCSMGTLPTGGGRVTRVASEACTSTELGFDALMIHQAQYIYGTSIRLNMLTLS